MSSPVNNSNNRETDHFKLNNTSFYQCPKCSNNCHDNCICRCHFMSCKECDEVNCQISACPHECHKDDLNLSLNMSNLNLNNQPQTLYNNNTNMRVTPQSELSNNNLQIGNMNNVGSLPNQPLINNLMKRSNMNQMDSSMGSNMNYMNQMNMNPQNMNYMNQMNMNPQNMNYMNQMNMNPQNMNYMNQMNMNPQNMNYMNQMNMNPQNMNQFNSGSDMTNSNIRNLNITSEILAQMSPIKILAKTMLNNRNSSLNVQQPPLGNIINQNNQEQYNDGNFNQPVKGILNKSRQTLSQVPPQQNNTNNHEEESYYNENEDNNELNSVMTSVLIGKRKGNNSAMKDESVNIGVGNRSTASKRVNANDEKEFIRKLEMKTKKEKDGLKASLIGRKQSKYSTIVIGDQYSEEEKIKLGLVSDFKRNVDQALVDSNLVSKKRDVASTILNKNDADKHLEIFKWREKTKKKTEMEERIIEADFDAGQQEEVPQGQKRNLPNNLQKQFQMARVNLQDPDKLENYRNEKFVREKSTIAREAEFLNREIKNEKVSDKEKLANSIFADIAKQESWQLYTTLLFANTEVKGSKDATKKE